ncbi:MAG TPA: response regulator [Burkholderiales bacterium]|nr:response regulator [Burkholderiales bacterium]
MPNILVLDDDPDMRALMQRHLTGAGYEVTLAESANAASETIAARRPDLIIADVNMPEVSGVEFVSKLRDHARSDGIPVIYLTGMEQTSELAVKTVGFPLLAKPVVQRELLALVKRQLPSAPRK